MPTSPVGIYVAGSIAVVGAGVAFKKYVYDPHIKPIFEDMLDIWLHHTQCLTNPVAVTFNPAEEDQIQRFQQQVTSPPTPWHRYHPSRKIDTNADSDYELEREMDLLGIPEIHQEQLASPSPLSPGLTGLNPWGKSSENEARRGGKLSSALGIDLSGAFESAQSSSSAVATGVQTSFSMGSEAQRPESGSEKASGFLRQRHIGPDHDGYSGNWDPPNNSSRSMILPAMAHVVPVRAVGSHLGSPRHLERTQEREPMSTALSSPDLTESSLIDVTSFTPSARSVSSVDDREIGAALATAPLSSYSFRAHSPAFSSSSYEVLSSPPEIASMANSPHSTSASISLTTYPAIDEYDSRHARYHARDGTDRNPSHTPSDSEWTDGDLGSDV
ncbi:hypothetical protein NliqN6_3621 [Naganishia liquefaciens]|uniref:Uncharacterized protein n=1 Tax=Naganishia liquefaciens TaxID=104408 RepID=A0A8H3YF49_9TREE|nr:hypothetical protein NliqN6_3621 [Naganishia liquefaciens]